MPAPRITDPRVLDHAITELVAATDAQDAIAARVTALRAAVEPAVRGRVALADRWTRDYGVVRWDASAESIGVTDPIEVASYIAQHNPDNVTVTVEVRAQDLRAILDALEFAGVQTIGATAAARPAALAALLKGCAIDCVPAGIGPDSAPIGRRVVDRETGEYPGGLGIVKAAGKMVLNLAKPQKDAHAADADGWVDTVLAATPVVLTDIAPVETDTDPLPLDVAPAEAPAAGGRYIELASLKLDDLKRAARGLSLSVAGSKADLIGRIQLAERNTP